MPYRRKPNVHYGRPSANYTPEELRAARSRATRKCQLKKQGLTIEEYNKERDKKREERNRVKEEQQKEDKRKKELRKLKKLSIKQIAAIPAALHSDEHIKKLLNELNNAIVGVTVIT